MMAVAVKELPGFTAEAVEALANAVLHGVPEHSDVEYAIRATPNPFPGLRFYTSDISEVFVGRDEQINEILERLGRSQTVLILGGSGCGKSSLIRGGVLARLTGTQPVPGRHGAWYSISWRPERKPCSQLVDAFWQDYAESTFTTLLSRRGTREDPGDDHHAKADLLGALPAPYQEVARSATSAHDFRDLVSRELQQVLTPGDSPAHHGLAELRLLIESFDRALSGDPDVPGANVLFVVDQFEEIFRSEVDRVERDMLMSLIRYVYEFKPPGVYLALVMRSEDLHRCAEEPHLPDIVNTSSMFVDWLDRAQLRQIITEPACRVFRSWLDQAGAAEDEINPFAPELVEALLDETELLKKQLEHKGDHLPLLQHGLRILWHDAAIHWLDVAQRARAAGVRPTGKDLRIELGSFTLLAAGARARTAARNPNELAGQVNAQANKRTKLEWLLSDVAEEALATAVSLFDHRNAAPHRTPPISFFEAAFCELASRDENSRYYRKFRTVDEIINLRIDAAHRPDNLKTSLSAGLTKFRECGLLTQMGSGAWDVTHEALIRNWTRLRDWVASDLDIRSAMQKSFRLGAVTSWIDARTLRPVLGYPRSPIHPLAWVRNVATADLSKGANITDASFRATWRGLRWSYVLERYKKPMIAATVSVLLLISLFSLIVYGDKERLRAHKALMSSYAVAAETLSNARSGESFSSTRDRAIGLWNAVRLLEDARKDIRPSQREKDQPVLRQLSLTETTVDTAIRSLLGRTLIIDAPPADASGSPSSAQCEGGSDTTASQELAFSTATGRGVRLLPAENGQRRLVLQSSEGTAVILPRDLSPTVSFDTQVCMSDDGQVLATASPQDPVPRVYDLGWYSWSDSPDGAAAPTLVQAIGRIEELDSHGPGQKSFATTVTGISSVDSETGARSIWFDVTDGGRTAKLRARYFEGYAAPARVSNKAFGQACLSLPSKEQVSCRSQLSDHLALVSGVTSSQPSPGINFPSNLIRLYSGDGELTNAVDAADDRPFATVSFSMPAIRAASAKLEAGQQRPVAIFLEDVSNQHWQFRLLPGETSKKLLKDIFGPIPSIEDRKQWKWSTVCRSQECSFEGLDSNS